MATRIAAQNGRELENTQKKLSSGKRINKAADDAARLAIATKISAQTRGKNQAIRNTNDAISIIQMAEGGLGEVSNMIGRVRQLAIQSASGTVSNSERHMLEIENQQTMDEITRISGTNVLFGHELLQGHDRTLEFQIDAGANGYSRVKLNLSELDQRPESLGIDNINLSTQYGAQQALEKLDKAHDKVSELASKLGSYQKRFNSTYDKLGMDVANNESAYSRMMDTDYAAQSAKMASEKIKQSAATGTALQLHGELKQAVRLLG